VTVVSDIRCGFIDFRNIIYNYIVLSAFVICRFICHGPCLLQCFCTCSILCSTSCIFRSVHPWRPLPMRYPPQLEVSCCFFFRVHWIRWAELTGWSACEWLTVVTWLLFWSAYSSSNVDNGGGNPCAKWPGHWKSYWNLPGLAAGYRVKSITSNYCIDRSNCGNHPTQFQCIENHYLTVIR